MSPITSIAWIVCKLVLTKKILNLRWSLCLQCAALFQITLTTWSKEALQWFPPKHTFFSKIWSGNQLYHLLSLKDSIVAFHLCSPENSNLIQTLPHVLLSSTDWTQWSAFSFSHFLLITSSPLESWLIAQLTYVQICQSLSDLVRHGADTKVPHQSKMCLMI